MVNPERKIPRRELFAATAGIVFVAGSERQVEPQTINYLRADLSETPGITKQNDVWQIAPTGFSLVDQDGTKTQDNPPINLRTPIEFRGDFAITTSLARQRSKTATLDVYGKMPIVADEFRIEEDRMQVTVSEKDITVSVWNKKDLDDPDQKPQIRKSFPISEKETTDMIIMRNNDRMQFHVNGEPVGSVDATNLFTDNKLWFGMESSDTTWALKKLDVDTLRNGSIQTIYEDEYKEPITFTEPGLQQLVRRKRPDFTVGIAQALIPSVTDAEYAAIALDKDMFGGMTPENAMKMANIQPQRGKYTFDYAEQLVDTASMLGIAVHGHTLVFGEANPPWFNELQDPSEVKDVMIDLIDTTVRHFKGRIKTWDVINEPMDETDDGKIILRNHKWKEAMGKDYMITALDTAYKADPDGTYFINENGIEADGPKWNAFLRMMVDLQPQLIARGIPPEKIGVGFQAHVYEAGDRIDTKILRKHMRTLDQLGYMARVSENDVYSDDGDDVQAKQYTDVFQAALAEPNCIGWSGWILSDRYDYYKDDEDGNRIKQGKDGLFDTDMKPRPALRAMQQSLR